MRENRNGLPNYSDLHPLSIQTTAAKVRRHFFISMKRIFTSAAKKLSARHYNQKIKTSQRNGG